MSLSVITVVSLLMMFCGRIAAEEKGEDVGLDPSVSNVFTRYGSDHCCSRIDNQTTILEGISFATEKLTKDVGEMKKEVENDIPSELEKLSSELKSELKGVKASVGDIAIGLNKHSNDLLVHDAGMKELKLLLENMNNLVKEIHVSHTTKPKDCSDIRAMGQSASGVYRVYPGSQNRRIQADVYCDMTTPGGNWLVFQRRKDGSVNFERTWNEYQNGFGNPGGEFWLGNEALYLLTSNGKYKLRIDLEDFNGQKRYAEYSTFSVGSSVDKYRLTVSGYTGNVGDNFSYQNGSQFSTKDADNDIYDGHCAKQFRGAWWYNKGCHQSNLNGLYLRGPHKSHGDGINWYYFHGHFYSLKMTEMKIAAVGLN